jgi:ATPase family AAA domain-containing protein 2
LILLARGEKEPECLAHTRFRRNEDGTIRDVTSNKRFYNMDLDTMSDRLWNGYYLTPDQFVSDIHCMVHDSKTWPDRDRTNRAEEMIVNTQTYVSEVFEETLVLECQRMAEREYEREKITRAEREAKAKKKAEREKEKERLRLAAAAQQVQDGQEPPTMIEFPPGSESQTSEANGNGNSGLGIMTNGDVYGAVEEDGAQVVPESSPFRSQQAPSQAQIYSTSTAVSPTSTQPYQQVPTHPDWAVPSYNSYLPPILPSNVQPHVSGANGTPQDLHQPTPLPGLYQHSNPAGGIYPQLGYTDNSLHLGHFASNPSQTLSTLQPMNHHQVPAPITNPLSQSGNQIYQPSPPPAPFGGPSSASTSSAVLVAAPQRHMTPTRSIIHRPTLTPHPSLKKDPARVERLLHDITRQTDGYTLEQLEQVYSVCMDIIWRLRHEWDRTVVISETEKSVRRVLGEIDLMQKERQQDQLDLRGY